MAVMADTPDIKLTKVITLGCRLNAYESDVIAQNARDAEDTGAVVINTCAVTNDAVAESRRQVRKAKRDNPQARIIVTGCAAQIDPNMFADMSEVDQVLGNHEKMNPMSFGPDAPTERIRVNDIMSVRDTAPQFMGSENSPNLKSQSRSRAFLQVQNGCDHRCTFCIIPYGRGNARSVPAGEVVRSVKSLVAQGYNEVVLTGVDLSSWGTDLPGTPPLGDLVRRILKLVPDLPRLRLSSIDPAEVDDGPYLRSWGNSCGIHISNVMATELAINEGRITGNLKGYNVWGENKVRRILDQFPPHSVKIMEAYGDTRGDREMLHAAEASFFKPFRVTPIRH